MKDRRFCPHDERFVLNPWERLRKYVCDDCGAVLTCACDREIAENVLPHQAGRGVDPRTRARVPVTTPLFPDVCPGCRGAAPIPYPATTRGATSKLQRYYWHEIWKTTQLRFLAWCRAQGLSALDAHGRPLIGRYAREHADEYGRIRRDVLDGIALAHQQRPVYDFSEPSDADLLAANSVVIDEIDACYVTPTVRRARVLPLGGRDPDQATSVEVFVADILRGDSQAVMFCESRPVHALYGCLMWLWVQDPADPELQPRRFGGRDGIGADARGMIWTMLPPDFGAVGHAERRASELDAYLAWLPDEISELVGVYDYWLEPSRPLRQYLWAYTAEDEGRARILLRVLGPQRVKTILRYLAEHYWGRYLGWPDLFAWRESQDRFLEPQFVEVKSSGDKLSADQREWIEGNARQLRLPFRLAKVHRAERLKT